MRGGVENFQLKNALHGEYKAFFWAEATYRLISGLMSFTRSWVVTMPR